MDLLSIGISDNAGLPPADRGCRWVTTQRASQGTTTQDPATSSMRPALLSLFVA